MPKGLKRTEEQIGPGLTPAAPEKTEYNIGLYPGNRKGLIVVRENNETQRTFNKTLLVEFKMFLLVWCTGACLCQWHLKVIFFA